jgi:site-specific DNA recombinase
LLWSTNVNHGNMHLMTDASPPLPLWLAGRPATAATSTKAIWTAPPVQHHHVGPCSCEPTLAYIRVSKVGKRQIIISPDIQFSAIVENCRVKSKRIVGVVTDIDKSGRTFIKRSVDGAIRDLANGVAKSITVWKWSRWGRNLEYSLAYLAEVQRVGGRVDSATDDIEQITATGRFSRDLVMRVDQLNSELIGESWQATHSQRREDGLPHSGRERFGYQYLPAAGRDQPARYEPLEPGATALKGAYERYVAGTGMRPIAKWLNGQGLRTTSGGSWTRESVASMLDTGFAAGWIRERSEGLLAQHRAMQEDGKYVRNTITGFDIWRAGSHAAVISEDLWQAYKAKRLAQAQIPSRLKGGTPPHALSALMFCALCSRRLSTAYPGNSRVHTWRCSRGDAYHPGVSVSITNKRALDIVRAWVGRMAEPASVNVDELARHALASDGRSSRTAAQIQADIRAELRALDNLLDMAARKVVSEERYTARAAEYEARVAELRAEQAALTETPGRPGYEAFGALEATWDDALGHEPGLLNEPLSRVLAFVVVSPAEGRGREHDATDRVDLVGRWEEDSRSEWLERARRRSLAA